ncbi:ADP-ribosylation/Crystallin J1 [Powellomyces hirtus]|nr:ADP-ribosylation/Crystallin J1 [Powellomyces hirtus]
MTQINRHLLEDKIRGCIYGSILGDAMGLATEFMSKREAHAIYGGDTPLSFASIYQDSHRRKWVPGDFTDDTDQHMMVLASLVSLGKSEGMMLDGVDLGQRLAKWCESGFLTLSKPSLGVGATVGSVLTHEDFKKDPFKAAYSVWEKHGCDLAANGAVMRTGVIGCWAFWDEEVVVRNAVTAARVTHADPRCVFSSVVVCVLIARMLREAISDGMPVKPVDAGKQTVAAFPPLKKHNLHCFAPSIDALALDDAPARGYTLKCLGGALFCYTRQQLPLQKDDTNSESKGSHFKNVMTGLIMEAGDADTNGAVAGALVGCKVGYDNLPHDWLDGLKNREWIGERVNALLERVFEGLDQGLLST